MGAGEEDSFCLYIFSPFKGKFIFISQFNRLLGGNENLRITQPNFKIENRSEKWTKIGDGNYNFPFNRRKDM